MLIDKKIINSLLEKLKEYVYDLESMNFNLNDLEGNRDIQHLVNHRLHTAVEICIDIAMNVASALELPGRDSSFQQAPKLRNLLIHGYAKVDYALIFKDFRKDILEMKEFARQIKAYVDKN